ncbi:Orotidine 5'-phosphate decarboxylase [Candidatus Bilamarchaeum dharawalense]|uniref:Orotidine-5'-phosphate decarboxylase n=1 Tax=Candidatus Bilamarchaeum dharawalense TaxID=2885759 RepID=A0A5E4LNM8_9ARCH|nr:Orotidine 5'-phosphate decarboxylase [Candidatus Bilamarchaeum dharawalense]
MRETLIKVAEENKTILCFGVDPDLLRIMVTVPAFPPQIAIEHFFENIIDKLIDENAVAAIKPNYAYFAQYGFDGLNALQTIMQTYRNKIPIILDVKRGDIGKTSEAYAKEAYDFWGADAVTISPYMGFDSVSPFLRDGKLAYMLCKTSNKGSEDFQELRCEGKAVLYEKVMEKALEWKCGAVIGATSDAIRKLARKTEGRVPFLIPGIGTQGGDLEMVLDAIKGSLPVHRINASSSIAYAFEKYNGTPADAALKEAEGLNKKIRKYF